MVSEQSPLLPQPAPITNPNKQLALICAVRFIDPLTFTQIFPYINQFLLHLHIIKHKSQIGFYSGLVVRHFHHHPSSIPLIILLSFPGVYFRLLPALHHLPLGLALRQCWPQTSHPHMHFWLVSHNHWIGISLISSCDSSRPLPRFAWSVLSHCLSSQKSTAGVFSGNAAVLHAVVGEITSPTNQAFTFPVYGLFWPLGNVVGPLIGGALANPADEFPSLFDNAFFRDYPYFLPCFATGLVALVVGFATLLFLEETLPSKRPCQPTSTSPRPEQEHDTVSNLDPSAASNVVQLLRIPVIRALSVSGAFLCFTATAFDALFVIFCYTPIALGGLNFSASQIGYSLSIAGVSSILLQILFLPTLLLNVNHSRLYNICMGFWPLVFLSVPLLNIIARNDIQSSGKDELTPRGLYIVWIGIAVIMIMSRIGCLAYSISLVLVKQNTPSPHVLGKTNAIVLWAMCVSRALAPAFVSSFFALSIDKNLLGGFLWLVVMVFVAVLGCLVSLRISHSAGYNDDESEAANESLGEIAIIL